MVICRSACWPLVVIILFATFAAVAQTNSPAGAGGGKFRATCGEDLQQFCAGVQPGGGRLVQCLSSHTSELSAACGNLISAAGRSGAKLRAACDQDLQQFCVGVQPGGGRLVQCLSSHANELSAACGNMISAAGRSGAKLRTACDQDLQQFCAGVQPGGGRLAQCLSSHANELSAACGNMISAAGRGGATLRAVCDQDLQQFCVGVQPGRRPLVQCLSSHTGHLSAACRNMITAIHLKGSSNSSAESPAPQPAAPVTTGNSPATIGSILRASCGPDVERLCSEARRESDVLKCLDFSAHGTLDKLQPVFPEFGRAADRPAGCSKQKTAVAATYYANPGPGECSEQKPAVTATYHANPGSGECSEQKVAVAATNHANAVS